MNENPGSENAQPIEPAIITSENIDKMVAQLTNTAPEKLIEKYKEQYSKLTIAGPEDIGTYKGVEAGIKVFRDMRLAVERKRKELKKPIDAAEKLIQAEAKRLTALIQPEEDRLTKELQRIDNIKETLRLKKIEDRKKALIAAGFKFDGLSYVCGPYVIPSAGIEALTEEQVKKLEKDGIDHLEMERKRKKLEEEEAEKIKKQNELLMRETKEKDAEIERLKKQLAGLSGSTVGDSGLESDSQYLNGQGDNEVRIPMASGPAKPKTLSSFMPPPVSETSENVDHSQEYLDGFADCQMRVLKLLADPTQRKRSEFCDIIKGYKP